jgi:hypothetical protein
MLQTRCPEWLGCCSIQVQIKTEQHTRWSTTQTDSRRGRKENFGLKRQWKESEWERNRGTLKLRDFNSWIGALLNPVEISKRFKFNYFRASSSWEIKSKKSWSLGRGGEGLNSVESVRKHGHLAGSSACSSICRFYSGSSQFGRRFHNSAGNAFAELNLNRSYIFRNL